MEKLLLAIALGYSINAFSVGQAHLIEYDHKHNGILEQAQTMEVSLVKRGAILSGSSESNGVIVGNIEQLNDAHAGSGNERRFFFKLDDNNILKWFVGSAQGNDWTGVWFGESGERGDFSLRNIETTGQLPGTSDVMAFRADEIFSGGVYDTHNTVNEDFLNNRYGLDPMPFEQVNYKKGIYVQSDNGGLPFPMSFDLTFTKEFTLEHFRLGSFNNGQGTRLTTFDFEIWSNGEWVKVDTFNFAPIEESRHWQKHAFSLPYEVTTRKVRISATGTGDTTTNGRVLMWGLTFH